MKLDLSKIFNSRHEYVKTHGRGGAKSTGTRVLSSYSLNKNVSNVLKSGAINDASAFRQVPALDKWRNTFVRNLSLDSRHLKNSAVDRVVLWALGSRLFRQSFLLLAGKNLFCNKTTRNLLADCLHLTSRKRDPEEDDPKRLATEPLLGLPLVSLPSWKKGKEKKKNEQPR